MKNEQPLDDLDSYSAAPSKNTLPRLFVSAQMAALAGTVIDFLTVILLTELVGLYYVISNVIGAFFGAITNFLLGRFWVFSAAQKKIVPQAFRYFLVATGSMILNTLGLYGLTELTPLNYIVSKIVVAIAIAFTFNFFLQKNFVYR
ncbi:MAG: GtrA family protein [Bacteroidota bacterium]